MDLQSKYFVYLVLLCMEWNICLTPLCALTQLAKLGSCALYFITLFNSSTNEKLHMEILNIENPMNRKRLKRLESGKTELKSESQARETIISCWNEKERRDAIKSSQIWKKKHEKCAKKNSRVRERIGLENCNLMKNNKKVKQSRFFCCTHVGSEAKQGNWKERKPIWEQRASLFIPQPKQIEPTVRKFLQE